MGLRLEFMPWFMVLFLVCCVISYVPVTGILNGFFKTLMVSRSNAYTTSALLMEPLSSVSLTKKIQKLSQIGKGKPQLKNDRNYGSVFYVILT